MATEKPEDHQRPRIGDDVVAQQHNNEEMAKLITALTPKTTQQKLLESDTAKQILFRVTDDSALESTAQLTDTQEYELKKMLFIYQITGNPRIAIEYIATLRFSKSKIGERGSVSLLEGFFNYLNNAISEDGNGIRSKVGKWIAGR